MIACERVHHARRINALCRTCDELQCPVSVHCHSTHGIERSDAHLHDDDETPDCEHPPLSQDIKKELAHGERQVGAKEVGYRRCGE